ncbi:serine hydroxymethyltransferase, partial [Lactobacillus sanfranciscensis]|nr:serine hydroxymethyltransferase [Fructilactobacillus sanfranciscensis]
DSVKITTNKEALPNEKLSPFVTSGVRIGTPAITSRGFGEGDSRKVADLIIKAIENYDNQTALNEVKTEVEAMCATHPITR